MARLKDDGSLDFTQDDWQAPDPLTLPTPRRIQSKSAIGGVDPSAPVDPTTSASADPNSPAEIARLNTIYGPGGTVFKKPFPNSTWDPTTETWQGGSLTKPTGGNINDPAYLDQLLAYYGQQPGVNPSVTNDPGYWRQAVASGRFNGDEGYLIQRFMQPEGAPEGSTGGSGGTGPDQSSLSSFLTNMLMQNQGNNTDPARAQLLQRLNAMMDQYSQPVSPDDPTIKASTDAYTGQVNRGVNDFKNTAAERAYAEGVPTGAFDSQIGNAEQAGGRAVGGFQAQLMNDELAARRANLQGALGASGGLLSAQDSADIQNKIANMDAALKASGLDLTNKSLDITKLLGMTGLTQQNNQFYDQLGASTAGQGMTFDQWLQQYLTGGN